MKICAVIVTYNRLEKLKKTWAASRLQPFEHIIIIDNASTDGTKSWLDTLNDNRLTVIRSSENDGGAGGFFRGAKWVSENISADWVVLYDDDSYPSQELLESFLKTDRQAFDAFATKVVNPNGYRCKMNIPWIKLPNSLSDILRYYKGDHSFIADKSCPAEISTFSFVGVIIKGIVLKETFNKINDKLFIYYDDVYYSWYLKISGYKLQYDPNLVFIHDVQESATAPPAWKVYYLVRNLILSLKLFKTSRPFSILSMLVRIIKYIMLVHKSHEKKLFSKAILRGIIDGVYNSKDIG